jgi:hypothetical protein
MFMCGMLKGLNAYESSIVAERQEAYNYAKEKFDVGLILSI